MIALNYVIGNEINEYGLISNAKQEPSRTALINLRPHVSGHYDTYRDNFNTIHTIPPNPFDNAQSTHLRNCYLNPTKALESLKARIIDSQSDVFKSLCPYCLIVNHSTFDHYVPKEQHPVYSVYPRNLIPCCDPCNRAKNEYWLENNQRAILHFYNDMIPNYQFLVCDLAFNGAIPILSFRFAFPANTAMAERFIIERHFNRLHLLERYNDEVPKVLSDIDNDVRSQPPGTLVQDICDILQRKANIMAGKCGINYWYALAYARISQEQPYVDSLLP